MPRYTIFDKIGNYTLVQDNIHNTYIIFKHCKGFKQQISKEYIYFRCAVNKFFDITHNY